MRKSDKHMERVNEEGWKRKGRVAKLPGTKEATAAGARQCGKQRSLTSFYEKVTQEASAANQTKDFIQYSQQQKRERKKHQQRRKMQRTSRQHKDDCTIELSTVNVRGLVTHMRRIGEKLQGLKENHRRGQKDVIFIQETHLRPEDEEGVGAQYVAMWGFKATTASRFTFWASGEHRRAGVAILLNPYGAVNQPEPWNYERWSEHLIMIAGYIGDTKTILVNVYAPSNQTARVAFLQNLATIDFPEEAVIICGGDFNCVVERRLDRVGGVGTDDVGAKELTRFLYKNEMVDAGYYNILAVLDSRNMRDYATAHHTHRHKAANGSIGTSRIDRWYVAAKAKNLVRGQVTAESPCGADHREVLLELHDPSGQVRVAKREKLYPAPAYVQGATSSLVMARLKEFRERLAVSRTGDTIPAWEGFKKSISKEMLMLKRAARRRTTRGFRHKIRRLKKQLEQCGYGDKHTSAQHEELVRKLEEIQMVRRTLRRRITVARNAWSSTASTRHFLNRICTKFGDNTIPALVSNALCWTRGEHDKANIMADNWEPILNGELVETQRVTEYLDRLALTTYAGKLEELDTDISEEEVVKAIKRCKTGKACGPDGLANEWYLDHTDEVAPILTRLFNECMTYGRTPDSFLQAYIFSISKGGDRSNPLNYRPIALLNTDYKILTRILAWRTRRFVRLLVHKTQFGFVPGRDIHAAIDLLEAAKIICTQENSLSSAQVLRRKGFPPRFCKLVEATHRNTTVQFLANGKLSRAVPVSRGIRQGCPLAPLRFIVAVDVLYDEVGRDRGISGVPLWPGRETERMVVAGYADDTAIYIAQRQMQGPAIRAVKRFSAVSGLHLNVGKSKAIRLGVLKECGEARDVADGSPRYTEAEVWISIVEEVRYLGHTAGSGDTTEVAWKKAFESLRVRLALAELKTNTVSQRAMIATAIILPKLLYIARYAWPTKKLVKYADLRIRNFVWNSSFRMPDSAPKGWVRVEVAEQPPDNGGVGIPSMVTELMALSASMVGKWGLSEDVLERQVGCVLQDAGADHARPLTVGGGPPPRAVKRSPWATGRPWVELWMASRGPTVAESRKGAEAIRMLMRARHGLQTRWNNKGLDIRCSGKLRAKMMEVVKARRSLYGDFQAEAIDTIQLNTVWMWNDSGTDTTRKDYARVLAPGQQKMAKIGDVCEVIQQGGGEVICVPRRSVLTDTGRHAAEFREICLNLLASFPEIIDSRKKEGELQVHHQLEDPHHIFELDLNGGCNLRHTWSTSETRVNLPTLRMGVQEAAADILQVDPTSVWVVPHPRLQYLRPLWAGRRRWTLRRKDFRKLITRDRDAKAKSVLQKTQLQWAQRQAGVAHGLSKLDWKRLNRLEGATPYQTQTVARLKANRLRLWTGEGDGFQCLGSTCNNEGRLDSAHLAWDCPDAQQHWMKWIKQWRQGSSTDRYSRGLSCKEQEDIFSMQLRKVPNWLNRWGSEHADVEWEHLEKVEGNMWAQGCATTLTAIWRWNVDKVYRAAAKQWKMEDQLAGLVAQITEAFERYRWRLHPVTPTTRPKLEVVGAIISRWKMQGGRMA